MFSFVTLLHSCVDRFKTVKQLCAFIGIDPSIKQSGTLVNYIAVANKLLKTIFIMLKN